MGGLHTLMDPPGSQETVFTVNTGEEEVGSLVPVGGLCGVQSLLNHPTLETSWLWKLRWMRLRTPPISFLTPGPNCRRPRHFQGVLDAAVTLSVQSGHYSLSMSFTDETPPMFSLEGPFSVREFSTRWSLTGNLNVLNH